MVIEAKPDKVVVTNVAALKEKYGAAGYLVIEKRIEALIAADKRRGLLTRLVPLDDKATMRALSAPPVTRATDPAQNKRAIDGVYRAFAPDYLLILGAIDVVPHQDMTNPVHNSKGDDDDKYAYGDLPYACEAPYSRDAKDFVGPTRVVGRLPDVTGSTDPNYLAKLLQVAAEYKPTAPSQTTYFAVSAQIWAKSTKLSIQHTFNTSAAKVENVPPKGFKWSQGQLQARMHFFNCHGASRSSRFYGQPKSGKDEYPPALYADYIDGKIREGTIVAAECCYGAQLYHLSATQKHMGICNVYLANKAYGFFGSTTIAYGPEKSNGQADLVCRYFLQNVLGGASLGRAVLHARQTFVRGSSPIHPKNLKTLAQFNLYGDPSLTPMPAPKPFVTTAAEDFALAERSERRNRRRLLFRVGLDLAAQEPVPVRSKRKPNKAVRDRLHASARADGKAPGALLSFAIRHRSDAGLPRQLASSASLPTRFHVLFTKSGKKARAVRRKLGIVDITAFVGQEVDGELVSVTKIRSR